MRSAEERKSEIRVKFPVKYGPGDYGILGRTGGRMYEKRGLRVPEVFLWVCTVEVPRGTSGVDEDWSKMKANRLLLCESHEEVGNAGRLFREIYWSSRRCKCLLTPCKYGRDVPVRPLVYWPGKLRTAESIKSNER